MSGLLVTLTWKWNELADDLESFVHIICIMALRFHRHTDSVPGPVNRANNATNGRLLGAIRTTYWQNYNTQSGMVVGSYTKLSIWKAGDRYSPLCLRDRACGLEQLLQRLFSLCRLFYGGVDHFYLAEMNGEGQMEARNDPKFRFSASAIFDAHGDIKQAFHDILAILPTEPTVWPGQDEKTPDQFDGLEGIREVSSGSIHSVSPTTKRVRAPPDDPGDEDGVTGESESRPSKKTKQGEGTTDGSSNSISGDSDGGSIQWDARVDDWDDEMAHLGGTDSDSG